MCEGKRLMLKRDRRRFEDPDPFIVAMMIATLIFTIGCFGLPIYQDVQRGQREIEERKRKIKNVLYDISMSFRSAKRLLEDFSKWCVKAGVIDEPFGFSAPKDTKGIDAESFRQLKRIIRQILIELNVLYNLSGKLSDLLDHEDYIKYTNSISELNRLAREALISKDYKTFCLKAEEIFLFAEGHLNFLKEKYQVPPRRYKWYYKFLYKLKNMF